MQQGFIKVAVGTPEIRVADCRFNCETIIKMIQEASEKKVMLLILPELCITGYTCGDLFLQSTLLRSAEKALLKIAETTKGLPI